MKPKLIIAVILLAIALVFALLNSQNVTVNFLFLGKFQTSVTVLIFAVFALGFISGILFGLLSRGKKRP